MQRVLVIGCSGTGKSTFARALAGLTGLPVVHIDHLFWQANWIQVPREIYLVRLDQSVAGERWIIDGINTSTLDRRVPRADTIVWLQRSRIVCCWRIIRRVVGSYGQVRPDMAPGCPERLDWEFMKYIWRFPKVQHPRMVEALNRYDAWGRTIILRSDAESAAFLRTVAGT
jgi:adenylate kinase family enzyme